MVFFMRCACAVCLLSVVVFLPPLPGQTRAYLKMEIDPGSRILRLSDEVPIRRGYPSVEHFQEVIQGSPMGTRAFVDRVAPMRDGQPSGRTEVFYSNEDGVLVARRKFQEVFSGPLGVLVAESSYVYPGAEYGTGSIGFSVRVDNSSIRREVPKIIEALPWSATPLNSVTIIRIAKWQGIDLAAVATYSERGELFNVAIDTLKSGDNMSKPAKSQTFDEAIQESIRQFGFPLSFGVDEFQREPTPLYGRSDGPAPLTIISFHYARNRWVQQYIFHGSTETPSKYEARFLEFRQTPQDDDLTPFDQSLAWGPANDQRRSFSKK